jgi:hypothetical protein
MNRIFIALVIILFIILQQCKVVEVVETIVEPEVRGIDGYLKLCEQKDTIHSVTIRKADAIIGFQGDRYETKITLIHYFDSIIYFTAVSSGYEVLRGSVNKDSIKVIDRINKTVYVTPMHKRFGFKHPISFSNIEMLTSPYGCCDINPVMIREPEEQILFDLSEDFINRKIYMDPRLYRINKFEFYHTRSNKYIVGERTASNGIRIMSNFMINDLEINASGGELSYNQTINVEMDVNRRKYSFVELQ